jgi:PAS domain S-box-containing protein
VTAGIVLLALLPRGGIEGTGMYWSFVFPPTTYLFQGVKRGTWYNAAFFVAHVAFGIAVNVGAVTSFFPFVEFREAWSALVLLNILGYAAESGWDRARREVVRQQMRLSTLIANLPVGVLMIEKDGTPVEANESVVSLLSRSPSEVLDLGAFTRAANLSKEDGSPINPEELPLHRALKTGEVVQQSGLYIRKLDGAKAVLRAMAAPIKDQDGKVSGAVGVYEDMTKEQEIDQMKSEFVSLASHQLKTPLTSVKWTAETLLGGDLGKLTDEQGSAVKEINSVADRVLALVTDLLSVSRIETGRKFNIVRAPMDGVKLLGGVVHELTALSTAKGVTVRVADPAAVAMVDADENKIREVFLNLIGNAVKYSRTGGTVEVGEEKSREGYKAFFIKDSGLGIPQQQQKRVFEKFFRAANVEEDIEGTGLGLYITKAIVEKHDGRIWFDSVEGKGTTFHVELVAAKT